jgi:hypothetical protein
VPIAHVQVLALIDGLQNTSWQVWHDRDTFDDGHEGVRQRQVNFVPDHITEVYVAELFAATADGFD